MRKFASLLIALGVLVGVALGIVMLTGGAGIALPWIASIALAKATLLASVGLMGAGATLQRLARRRDARELAAAVSDDQSAPD